MRTDSKLLSLSRTLCGWRPNVNSGVNRENYVFRELSSIPGSSGPADAHALQSALAKSQRLISDPTGYGIVNLFTGLVTPSLVPLASSDSTV